MKNLLCIIGFHSWKGCTCIHCPATRDTGHDWDGCKCIHCPVTRDSEHDWVGCKCNRCSKTRTTDNPQDHNWDGCVCIKCYSRRNQDHDWNGCLCRRCSARRDQDHDWEDVTPAFGYVDSTDFQTAYEAASRPREYRCSQCGETKQTPGYEPWRYE